jgi:D-aminopeptidase
MTKLYITCDLEGIWGVNTWRQCHPHTDPAGYGRAVKQAARELGWVIDAAHQAGIDHITVNDAHEMMTNLSPEAFEAGRFPEGVHWLSGKPKVAAMMAGLDSSFDAYALVGYHAMAGTEAGTLCHTFHRKLAQVRINGVAYGEGGLNTPAGGLYPWGAVNFWRGRRGLCARDAAGVWPCPVCGHQNWGFDLCGGA